MIERVVSALPLVAKELEEQAARKQTYRSRVVMGIVLFGAFSSVYLDVVGAQFDQLTVLGQGGRLFEALLLVLLSYVCFIVPGYSSAALSSERRNGSLELLRLTPLGPTSIVVQKFVGRLIPVLCNLMIGVPVLVITYAFGGVERDDLVIASVALVATALVLSAIALDLSAAFDSSEVAFGGTILVAGALGAAVYGLTQWWPPAAPWAFGFAPPLAIAYGAGAGPVSWLVLSLAVGGVLVPSVFLLDAARRLAARNRSETEHEETPSARVVRAVRPAPLPDRRPIAWRERYRRRLGSDRFAVRFVLVVIGFAVVAASIFASDYRAAVGLFVASGLWAGGMLVAIAGTVASVAAERTEKTFEVLMTTPLTGPEILRDKMIGVRRFQTRILTVACVAIVLGFAPGILTNSSVIVFGIAALIGLTVDIAMLSWLAVWIGLSIRNPRRASVVTLLVIGVVSVAPFVFGVQSGLHFVGTLLSPAFLLVSAFESVWRGYGGPDPGMVIVIGLVHVSLWAVVRQHCLKRADHYLGRVEFNWWSRQRVGAR